MPPRRSKNKTVPATKKEESATTMTRRGKKKNGTQDNDENEPPHAGTTSPGAAMSEVKTGRGDGGRTRRGCRAKKQVSYNDNTDTEPESDSESDSASVVEASKAARGKKRAGAGKGGTKKGSMAAQQPVAKKQKFLPSPPAVRPADNNSTRAIVGRETPSPYDWRSEAVRDY